MKKIRGNQVQEFFYDSAEGREMHRKKMIKEGWDCSDQIQYTTSSLLDPVREFKWYGYYIKYDRT